MPYPRSCSRQVLKRVAIPQIQDKLNLVRDDYGETACRTTRSSRILGLTSSRVSNRREKYLHVSGRLFLFWPAQASPWRGSSLANLLDPRLPITPHYHPQNGLPAHLIKKLSSTQPRRSTLISRMRLSVFLLEIPKCLRNFSICSSSSSSKIPSLSASLISSSNSAFLRSI